MEKVEQLEFGKFYHIYNRGINKGDVFFERSNYEYFIRLYEKHIDPIADTYAWCLMKNHFHFLVKIKDENEIQVNKLPHQYFSNLFNAYTKGINKTYNRQSSLFQRTFKRKLINDEKYFKQLVIYIHNNPVNHAVCKNKMDYPWSSYLAYVSGKQTNLKIADTLNYFGGLHNFEYAHAIEQDFKQIEANIST